MSTVALLVLHNAPEARAETTKRLSSRLYAGVAFGGIGSGASLCIDDGPSEDEGGTANLALNAAYLQGILPYFGVGLFAGVGSANTAWSADRGENRTRVPLALGPVFIGPVPGGPGVEWRIGLPVGYTLAWFKPAKGRAVEESYSSARGINASLVLGADIIGKHHGGFIDLAYTFHLTWLTHTATLRSDESVRVQQSYRYFERALALGAGYVYQF